MKTKRVISYPFLLVWLMLPFFISGCSEDDEEGELEPSSDTTITILDIQGIPENVSFDRAVAEITGNCWSIIGKVEGVYKEGQIILDLPTDFALEQLQNVDRRDNNMCGYWPATSSDPEALVATLGDIIAYQGDKKVGRIYLSNWTRKGSSAGKAFIYYQYADRAFTLTGSNSSYRYSNCSFNQGWNAYANINPASEDSSEKIRCTTAIPQDMGLFWGFETWVY